MKYNTKSTQPPLLCLLLGYPLPPPGADVLYVWSLIARGVPVLLHTVGNYHHGVETICPNDNRSGTPVPLYNLML